MRVDFKKKECISEIEKPRLNERHYYYLSRKTYKYIMLCQILCKITLKIISV